MDTNNYPSYTYPDSNNSSPRSRDLDNENLPPSSFDDQSFTKVKFMVSYGGKLQPRSHDNLLSYLGGNTKILSVDRYVKFNSFYSKLASVVSPEMTSFTLKYQLPGEDLDALISVTNDEDVELMMQEFDRVMRGSIKLASARLRLFLFTHQQVIGSGNGGHGQFSLANSETRILARPVCESVRDVKFTVASDAPLPMPVPLPLQSNADFMFGLDRMPVQVIPGAVSEQELVNQMNRLHISAKEEHHKLQLQNQQKQSASYPFKNEDSFADPYQKSSQMSAGYWQTVEQPKQPPQHPPPQVQHHQEYNPQLQQLKQLQQQQQQQLQQQQQQQQQQQVYMMQAPSQTTAYHAQSIMRPNQGGYQPVQQSLSSEQVYKEQQPVYSMPAAVAQVRQQGESVAGYAQQTTGRQVFYAPAAQPGVVVAPPYPVMSAAAAVVVSAAGDMRRGSGDGKIVHKVMASPTTV